MLVLNASLALDSPLSLELWRHTAGQDVIRPPLTGETAPVAPPLQRLALRCGGGGSAVAETGVYASAEQALTWPVSNMWDDMEGLQAGGGGEEEDVGGTEEDDEDGQGVGGSMWGCRQQLHGLVQLEWNTQARQLTSVTVAARLHPVRQAAGQDTGEAGAGEVWDVVLRGFLVVVAAWDVKCPTGEEEAAGHACRTVFTASRLPIAALEEREQT